MRVIRDDLLGGLVDLFPDAQVRGAAPAVVRAMRPALILRQLHQRCVPALGAQPPRGVDREPDVLADFRPCDAFDAILVEARRPIAGRIDLRTRGWARQRGEREQSSPGCGAPPSSDPTHSTPSKRRLNGHTAESLSTFYHKNNIAHTRPLARR